MALREDRLPTIYDVAKRAGVSAGTASKALNGQGQLRVETKARVLRAAAEINYQPNSLARSMSQARKYTIGLLCADHFGRISIPLIEGIDDVLARTNISVFLCNAASDPIREEQHLRALLSRRVDGIIVTATKTDTREPVHVGHFNTPVVYAYSKTSDPSSYCVVPDDVQGGQIAAEHLLAVGRRRLAYIGGPSDSEAVHQRLSGVRRALGAANLEMPDCRVLFGPWTSAWGDQAASLLFELDSKVDGIVCANDEIASGVLHSLRDNARQAPADVSIVGYDNWEQFALATRPTLTTVDMRVRALGQEAARLLLQLIEKPLAPPEAGVRTFSCSLVVRDSSLPVAREPSRGGQVVERAPLENQASKTE